MLQVPFVVGPITRRSSRGFTKELLAFVELDVWTFTPARRANSLVRMTQFLNSVLRYKVNLHRGLLALIVARDNRREAKSPSENEADHPEALLEFAPLLITFRGRDRLLQALHSFGRPVHTHHLELLSPALVIGDEEFFHLIEHRFRNFADRLDLFMTVGMYGDSDQAVILRGLAVLRLLGLNETDQADVQNAPDVRWFVHQHHDVDRIAIGSLGGRHKTEIERKTEPFG